MNANERLYILVLLIFSIPLSVSAQLQQEAILYPYWNDLFRLAVKDDILAIAAGWDGCVFLDVTDPHNPEHIGRYYADVTISDIVTTENHWIIANRDGVDIVTYNGNSQPVRIGNFGLHGAIRSASYVYDSLYAHAYWFAPGLAECSISDVTDPVNPETIATLSMNQIPIDIVMNSEDVYLAYSDHVKLYSFFGNEFTLLDSIGFAGSDRISMMLVDSVLTIAARENGLYQFTKSSTDILEQTYYQTMNLQSPEIIPWDGNHFVIIDSFVRMVEITDDNLVTIDSVRIDQSIAPVNSVKVQELIFIGFHDWENYPQRGYMVPVQWVNGGFVVGDEISEYGCVNAIESDESILSVVADSNRIDIFDLSLISQPELQSSIEFSELYPNVVIEDSILFVAENDIGFHIYDVTDPQQPTYRSTVDFPENMYNASYSYLTTFLIEGNFGLFTSYSDSFFNLVLVNFENIEDPTAYYWQNPQPPGNTLFFNALLHPDCSHLVLTYGRQFEPSIIMVATRPDLGDVEIVSEYQSENAYLTQDLFLMNDYLCATNDGISSYGSTTIFDISDFNNISEVMHMSEFGGNNIEVIDSTIIFSDRSKSIKKFKINDEGQIVDTLSIRMPKPIGYLNRITDNNTLAVKHLSDVSIHSGIENWLGVEDGGYEGNSLPVTHGIKLSAYPNPFNSSTIITCNLPAPGFYTLDIYNILAQKVATIHNGFLDAGPKKFHWDGFTGNQQISSGTYYLILNGERRSISKINCLK